MSTDVREPSVAEPEGRRPGELGPRELARWAWRQLVSMRTALILLLMLALAAIPGSVIPQRDVDSLEDLPLAGAAPRSSPPSSTASGSSRSTTPRGSPRSTCC